MYDLCGRMPHGGHIGGIAALPGRWRVLILALALAILVPLGVAGAAESEEQKAPRIRKVGPHKYQVGTVLLDSEKKTVRCRGEVNMNEGGPIELLACRPEGKTHESVFVLHVAPLDLQLALLLLDLNHGRNIAFRYHPEDPDGQKPPGDVLHIYVEWQPPRSEEDEGEEGAPERRRARAEQFLYLVQKGKPLEDAEWVFLGSRLLPEGFGANLEGSLISTYHDPLAILELQHQTVRDDVFHDANEELCPPVGTPVELIIQVPPKKEEPKEGEEDEAEEDEAE